MVADWLEQTAADVPVANDWLSPREGSQLQGLLVPKRRADWRLGRWTAKHAVAAYLDLSSDHRALASIEIRPADSGAPEVCFENNQAHVSISLSHRAGIGACAIAPAGMMLGCDLEVVEPRSDAFVEDYFTTEEREMLQGKSVAHRFRILALLWSAKESTLKVLRTGLRLDTRCVAITVCDDFRCMTEAPINKAGSQSLSTENWRRFRGCQANDRVFYGWWQERGNVVRTIAAEQPIKPPRVVLVRR